MAIDTSQTFRNLVIYEVYVRDHGPNGTFKDVEMDLDRIKNLGVDVVWFMPIHPIGKVNKKGELGCPYSIANYEQVNPEYGNMDDFKNLVQKAHQLGLKVMIDVVYNHTSHDSKLVQNHPEWFHRDGEGKAVSTVPDWSDVIDLNYADEKLEIYLVKVLKQWAKMGVDGFRCDVATLVPLRFWERARREVAKIKPEMIWLAESVQLGFVEYRRKKGLTALSDGELYRAFDITYDYDIWPIWQAAVQGRTRLRNYLQMVRFQSGIYPENYIKMRCVENHDNERIQSLAPSSQQALAWTAFSAFLPGPFLIYAGQESAETVQPSLFNRDPIDWEQYSLAPFIKSLAELKKHECQKVGQFNIIQDDPFIQATWNGKEKGLYGIFNVTRQEEKAAVILPDGNYTDLISGAGVTVLKGKMQAPENAYILEVKPPVEGQVFYSKLIDFHTD